MRALMSNEKASELHTVPRLKEEYWGNTKKKAFKEFKKEMERQAKKKEMVLKYVKL